MRARTLLVGGGAMLAAVAAVAGALPAMDSGGRSSLANGLWPSHPSMLTNTALVEIGTAAAASRGVPASARLAMRAVAQKAPLEPEPFLVEGAIAQTAGDADRAQHLFEAARSRDPRSSAARFFLAQRYLATGSVDAGLSELLVLSRIAPGAGPALLPSLTAFATMPGAAIPVRRFLASAPEFRQQLLSDLAQDSRRASLVLALAGSAPEPGPWQTVLIQGLVDSGETVRAYALWRQLAGVKSSGALFNPGFRPVAAPPPFNWTLGAGTAALVEPADNDGLQIIYYGRDNTLLAGQVMLLAPGRYRLSMQLAGPSDGSSVEWRATCVGDKRQVLKLPLAGSGSRAASASFIVPTGCAAQRLELVGVAGDQPSDVDIRLGSLHLEREWGKP